MNGKNKGFAAVRLNNFYLFIEIEYIMKKICIVHIADFNSCNFTRSYSVLGVQRLFRNHNFFAVAGAILSPYYPLECLLFYLSRCSARNGIARD